MLAEQVGFFARRAVRLLRLDAVGYVAKVAGTSCFMVNPGVEKFLDWLRKSRPARMAKSRKAEPVNV